MARSPISVSFLLERKSAMKTGFELGVLNRHCFMTNFEPLLLDKLVFVEFQVPVGLLE